jgi:hypothetical protein
MPKSAMGYPLGTRFTFHKYQKVIRISYKIQISLFQLIIQLIQYYIR